jgi:RNA polymerase sigma-70 factor, ECF subfamily
LRLQKGHGIVRVEPEWLWNTTSPAGNLGTNDCMVLDDATFEEIVNANYESLYRFALSLTQREEEARDRTQEAFAQLARKSSQVQDKAKIKSWLFTTLYRAFLDSRRWHTRHPHVEMEAVDYEMPVSLPNGPDRIDAATAREALMQVDEVFRAPLVLFYLEDHSYREIAEILGIPAGTVMSRISRGRAMLRQLLEDKPANVLPLPPPKTSVVS